MDEIYWRFNGHHRHPPRGKMLWRESAEYGIILNGCRPMEHKGGTGSMARGKKQKLKLFYLYKVMCEETDRTHYLTMPQIVERLASYGVEADRKSLYDDMEALDLFGIKVQRTRDGAHTYYNMTNRPFELAEMKILVDAVQASKFISEKETKEIIRKLLNLVSMNDARLLERDVHVPGRIKTMNESVYYTVDVIFRALNLDQQLRFHYFRWNVDGERELRRNGDCYIVSPWALHYDDEKYYLVAYDHLRKEMRHFRVDKMLDAEVVEAKRKGVTKYRKRNEEKYTQQHFRMFGGELQTVTLLCENEMSNVILDQFGRNTKLTRVDEDHFEVSVEVAVSDQFFGWVIALGDKVRIVGPENVMQQMKIVGKKVLEQYK